MNRVPPTRRLSIGTAFFKRWIPIMLAAGAVVVLVTSSLGRGVKASVETWPVMLMFVLIAVSNYLLTSDLADEVLGKHGSRYWVHLGGRFEADGPSGVILDFARVFDRLPPGARRIFDRVLKEFDIGVEAGSNVLRAGEWVLSGRALEAVTRLGATIRITVYEASELREARQRPKRKK